MESLDAPACWDRTLSVGSSIPDDIDDLPLAVLERSERERILREAVEEMPEINQTVLTLSYRDDLTRREVAAAMGVDVLRVTQLKVDSMNRLRSRVTKRFRCPATHFPPAYKRLGAAL
jgi:DNA-directed RNA polymerase specialized sigma subunit